MFQDKYKFDLLDRIKVQTVIHVTMTIIKFVKRLYCIYVASNHKNNSIKLNKNVNFDLYERNVKIYSGAKAYYYIRRTAYMSTLIRILHFDIHLA